jgi:hypothetical protein
MNSQITNTQSNKHPENAGLSHTSLQNGKNKRNRNIWEKVQETIINNIKLEKQESKDEYLQKIINIRKDMRLLNQKEIVYHYEYYIQKILLIKDDVENLIEKDKDRLRKL